MSLSYEFCAALSTSVLPLSLFSLPSTCSFPLFFTPFFPVPVVLFAICQQKKREEATVTVLHENLENSSVNSLAIHFFWLPHMDTESHTQACISDVSVSDVWGKGQSEVHSFLTSGPSLGKIPSDDRALTLSFAHTQTHTDQTHTRYAYQSEEMRKIQSYRFKHDPLLLVLVNECVGNNWA